MTIDYIDEDGKISDIVEREQALLFLLSKYDTVDLLFLSDCTNIILEERGY